MRDVMPAIDAWRARGEAVAVATVVATWGSAPRGPGAKMAVSASGDVAGSVSGGCVEAAVVEAAGEVLRAGRARRLRFGVDDETGWSVGLACGGEIEVLVEPLDEATYAAVRAAVAEERAIAVVTRLDGAEAGPLERWLVAGGGPGAGEGGDGLPAATRPTVEAALRAGEARRIEAEDGSGALFVEVVSPAPTLVVVGGAHIAVALVALARTLGWRTVVVDPRRTFASQGRFPAVDRLVHDWPQEALPELGVNASTAVVVLSHDPKLDDPAVRIALRSPAFYVGVLGSRRTQARRLERLRAAGLGEAELERLHGPIGLDIGARTPEEIALAVLAEVVAARASRAA